VRVTAPIPPLALETAAAVAEQTRTRSAAGWCATACPGRPPSWSSSAAPPRSRRDRRWDPRQGRRLRAGQTSSPRSSPTLAPTCGCSRSASPTRSCSACSWRCSTWSRWSGRPSAVPWWHWSRSPYRCPPAGPIRRPGSSPRPAV